MKLFVFAVTLLSVSGSLLWAASALGWPEAIAKLTQEKRQAEVCVGLLKSRGDTAAKESAKLTYGLAKAKMDGVIAGLTSVLVEGGKPESLPAIKDSLAASGVELTQICDAAVKTGEAGARGVWDEVAKGAIEPLVKAISDGVAGLWSWKRDSDKLILETRKTQLEAAQWPEFADIAPR